MGRVQRAQASWDCDTHGGPGASPPTDPEGQQVVCVVLARGRESA